MKRLGLLIAGAMITFILGSAITALLPPLYEKSWGIPLEKLQPYTDLALKGRAIYIQEGCWFCHSQQVRPLKGDEAYYGPPSRPGEYVYDAPHLLGTRRIGPDLARVGGKYSDDWHIAHLMNPQAVVPGSIMPKFSWLRDDEVKALVAYLQGLGTAVKREKVEMVAVAVPPSPESISRGRDKYQAYCAGCHGEKGDGKGPAGLALSPKPRDFTDAPWMKAKGDEELLKVIAEGKPGTAMPAWKGTLSEKDMADVLNYIRTFTK